MSTRTATPLVAAVLVALLVGCSASSGPDSTPRTNPTPEPPPLQAAYDSCQTSDGAETLKLGDDGHTLVIDTGREMGPTEGLVCVFAQLDVSDAILASMESTTAMMGVQEADQEDLHFQWSYHPDNGMNVVITDRGGE